MTKNGRSCLEKRRRKAAFPSQIQPFSRIFSCDFCVILGDFNPKTAQYVNFCVILLDEKMSKTDKKCHI